MRPAPELWIRLLAYVRALTGDDAYERYLEHCRDRHPGEKPLERRAFYLRELERRWQGTNRCC